MNSCKLAVIYSTSLLFLMLLFNCMSFADQFVDAQANNEMRAERASKALFSALTIKGHSSEAVTNMIVKERFEDFEELSRYYEKQFNDNPIYESPLCKLYGAIDCKDPTVIRKLNRWVESRPSYASYAARGIYKVNRGFFIRGSNYIRDTPPENIEKMRSLFRDAKDDLFFAIEKNRKLSPAYCSLVSIGKASCDIVDAKKIAEIGIHEIPTTYYIRAGYLSALQPRWGGSYEKMKAFLTQIEKDADQNPRIWSLMGEVAADRARKAVEFKNYPEAIRLYTEALSYGDRKAFLIRRAQCYAYTKQYELSLDDYTKYQKYDDSLQEVNDYIKYLKQLLENK